MATSRNSLVSLVVGLVAALALIGTATASAAPPAIKFEKRQPKTALLGTKQKVELVAENPEGQERGYNLTFRDVLPVGVEYAGGYSPAPTIIKNKPAVGQTTLLFENVSDLSPKSTFAVSFEVEPSKEIFKLAGGKNKYTDEAEAFISEKPRRKPNFEKSGTKEGQWSETAIEKEKIAVVKKAASTELTAIEITKSEPSPEGEILRGIHEHQTVYTLTVKNNRVGTTEGLTGKGAAGKSNQSIIVEDWLPAGLEFLGCGKADNTTNTSTNPGSAEEYPGSGAIDPGHAPAVEACTEPFYVKTEKTDPPSEKLPEGIYTHVKWEGPASLLSSAEFKIQYVAAIPLLKNTTTWLGAEPAAEGGGVKQIANLNNNSGGETLDEEALINNALAKGKYEATEVKDEDEMTRTAEDLAIQKGTSPEQTKIFSGAETNWTLKLETSEYRRSEPVSITDELPNGLCPIGPRNYETETETENQFKPECAASATRHPSVRYLKGGPAGRVGGEEQIEYTIAKEEATGGFELQFNGPNVEALSNLEPSQELLITFPTTTRVFYQSNFKDSKPILTADSWINKVSVKAPSYTRCYVKNAQGGYEADPNCEKPGTTGVASVRGPGAEVKDASEAGQEAGGVQIEKTVRKNEGTVPAECTDPSGDYVKGVVSGTEPALPKYRPGDEICFRLVVKFASNLYAGTPIVSDFIPPDEELVQGSVVNGPANTVESIFNKKAAEEEEALEWTVGKPESKSVESGKVFEVRFKTKVSATAASEPGEVSGNLMKFLYSNSKGVTFPLRDRAEVERQEPNLELKKEVASVDGGSAGSPIKGGSSVKYAIKIPNTKGTLDAEEIEVWDNLPEGVTCAKVPEGLVSDGGKCSEGRIVWKGLSVKAKATGEVTYVMVVPTDVAPGHKYENVAGVVHFQSETNTGKSFIYTPTNNINPKAGAANAGEARGSASVTTTGASVSKTATTFTNQAGNTESQATIGELVEYTVTAKVPANSTIYGSSVLKDAIPSGLEFKAGSAKAKVGTEEVPTGGFTLVENKTGEAVTSVEVKFPETYATGASEGKITLTFQARVKDIGANFRGAEITNAAVLTFKDKAMKEGETVTPREAKGSVKTPLVEPEIKVYKAQLSGTTVVPGQLIEYRVSAEDVAEHSVANNVKLVDKVPLGMRLVGTPEKGGIYDSKERTITWELGTVNPGAASAANTRSYTLEVENPANAASTFKNEVVGTAQSMPPGQEGAPGRTTYRSAAALESRLVGATIAKKVEPAIGTIGSPLKYTLTMRLPPSVKFFNTTVVDTLPDGVAFDQTLATEIVEGPTRTPNAAPALTAEPEGNPQRYGWYFGTLPPSAVERELVVVFEGHVKAKKTAGTKVEAGAELTNSVTGLYNGEEGSKPAKVPTPGAGSGFGEQTNTATALTKVVEPNLTIEKAVTGNPALVAGNPPIVQPGTTLTYVVVVKNNGSSPAYDFEVADFHTANLRNFTPGPTEGPVKVVPKAGEPLVWQVEALPPGKEIKLTYTAELAPSKELESGEKANNVAAILRYFGLPSAERATAKEKREYAKVEASRQLEVELPAIGVTKTTGVSGFPGEAVAEVNQPFPWRVVVANTAPHAGAKGVNVEDLLPANWQYVKGTTTFTAVGGAKLSQAAFDPASGSSGGAETLTWANVAELPAGSSVEVRFQATPLRAAAEEAGSPVKVNNATGRFVDLSGAAAGKKAGYEAAATAKAKLLFPQLTIEKRPDNGTAVAGAAAAYQIKVSNSGTGAARELEVKDVLSPGQELVGPVTANPSAGFAQKSVETDTPGKGQTTAVWTIAELAAGGEVTINVPIKTAPSLKDNDKVSDVAEVSAPQAPPAKPDEGSFVVHRETLLELHKTASVPSINAGESLEYSLEVINKGPSDATGIKVTDPLPASTEYLGGDPECVQAGGTVTCTLAELKAATGENTLVFHFKVKVRSGTTETVKNTATVTDDQKNPKAESTAETPIGGSADLSIVKTGPAQPVLLGSTFTYTLQVKNEGPSDATKVEVGDHLPSQVKFVSAQTTVGECDEAPGAVLTCALGTLLPEGEATIVVTVEATEVGAFENEATVKSPVPDPDPADNSSKAPAEVLPAADLAIAKTAPATVETDGTLTYTLHVENLGPSIAHKVTVADPLPAGVDFVSASEGCANAAGIVTCTVRPAGELAVGDAVDFQVTVHVPYALGGLPLVNTASVKGEEADPNTGNDSSTVTTTVGPAADLSIAKTMGKAEAGKPLTYTLAITNKGPSASSAVTVKDTLPAGTTFSSAAPSQGACSASGQEVTCLLGPLAASGSAQISITVDVGATVTGTLRNTAKVEGPEPDPEKANNESSVEGPVTPLPPTPPVAPTAPNLKVVKTVSTSAPQVGTPFDYQVMVTNMGGAEAKDVKVVDTLNGPVKVVSIDSDSGKCDANGSKINCTMPSIPVGKTVHITYSVIAEAAGALSNTASAQASNGETAPANNHAVKSVKATAAKAAKAAKANFTLTKTAAKKVVAGGKKVAFTITLRNGPTALVMATVCDRLPAALVFVKAAGASFVNGEACWRKKYVAAHQALKLHLTARAVRGFKPRKARNVASASAENAPGGKRASATVRIKPAFSGAPGGVTG